MMVEQRAGPLIVDLQNLRPCVSLTSAVCVVVVEAILLLPPTC